MASHLLTVKGQLLSINSERKIHRQRRAELVREWREAAAWEARYARIPRITERVAIVVRPAQHKAPLQDAGNCLPSVKPVIDALQDLGILQGDGPEHVSSLTMCAPVRVEGSGVDWITVELVEEPAQGVLAV